MKNLNIKFPNGEVFQIPTEVIAEQRTQYYAGVDGFEKGSKEWEDEFNHSMRPDEILDWVQNNMDWIDVKEHATKVPPSYITSSIDFNYDKAWFNSEFEVK